MAKPWNRRLVEVVLALMCLGLIIFMIVRVVEHFTSQKHENVVRTDLVFYDAPNMDQEFDTPCRPHNIARLVRNPQMAVRKRRFRVQTNSMGYRDDEFSLRKEPGTLRIAVVGECVPFGGGVDNDEVYPNLLEQLLEARFPDRKIEILNLGRPGEPEGVLSRLKMELPRLKPDIVLFSPGSSTVRHAAHVGLQPFRLWLLPAEYDVLLDKFRSILLTAAHVCQMQGVKLMLQTPTASSFYFPDGKYWIDAVKQMGQEKGLVVFDTATLVRKAEKEKGVVLETEGKVQRLVAYEEGRPVKVLVEAEYPDDNQVHVVDEIYRFLEEHEEYSLRMTIDDNHLTPEGHEVVAGALLELLISSRLLEPAPGS